MRTFIHEYKFELGCPYLIPLVEVTLIGPKGLASWKAILDSGADYPTFPVKAAEDVGITLPFAANCFVQYGGPGGHGRRVSVDMMFGDRRLRPEIIFMREFKLKYPLLGRVGFFSKFNEVCFIEKSRTPRIEMRW